MTRQVQKYKLFQEAVKSVREELEVRRDEIVRHGYDPREFYQMLRKELDHQVSRSEEEMYGRAYGKG